MVSEYGTLEHNLFAYSNSVDQDQNAQILQSDLGSAQSAYLCDIAIKISHILGHWSQLGRFSTNIKPRLY